MVWGLLPVDPSLGLPTYYFFSKGTYKIGRKDCDVIIEKDRTISRIHADLVIGWDPLQIKLNGHSKVSLTDHSKFGTFVNKESGSKPIFSLPNKQVNLKDGDIISFDTGNATFRFCFIPFLIFIHQTDSSRASSSVQDLVLFIGGCALNKWSPECTHVVVNALTPITEDIIEAVMEQKPVVLTDWVKAMAERKVSTEIPHCSSYTPTLTLSEGEFSVQVKIVEPEVRRSCLSGHTFMLGSLNMYKFGQKFKLLLEGCGAKVSSINSSNTVLAHGTDNVVLVTPFKCADAFNQCLSISQLPRIDDINLIGAVLSGHLNEDLVELPPEGACIWYSFKDLIPFSKDPYIETEGQSEREKFVREEKKRKQAEAIAEDLFNAERVKRQKGTVTSSLRSLILRH